MTEDNSNSRMSATSRTDKNVARFWDLESYDYQDDQNKCEFESHHNSTVSDHWIVHKENLCKNAVWTKEQEG